MTSFFRWLPRGLVFTLLLVVTASLLGGCGSDESAEEVEVIEPRLVKTQNGERAFAGTLVNPGSQSIPIAQVEVALYDDNGSEIETVRIDVEDIPAKDSMDFDGPIDSDRSFSQAQVKSVMTP
ncbi:MAG: FxLYD domain-containing protein [Salinivenus sp.]